MNNDYYRYTLDPYKGMKTRYTCPQCRTPKKFSRYLDKEKGELLPELYGKCERVNGCDYHVNPYKDGYSKKIWLAENKGQKFEQPQYQPQKSQSSKPKPITFIPDEIFKASLSHQNQNTFVRYLSQLFEAETTANLIQRFYIGSSNYWKGATVFWLVDAQMNIVGGQVILFDNNGNTKKEKRSDGSKKRFNGWVHTALKNKFKKQQNPVPDWLQDYIEYSPKFPCLFGLPQLIYEPKAKPVAIVEAAKTAIIATGYFPQYIWLAVGSLSYLNENRLQSVRGKNITLFPDKGGFKKWSEKAIKISNFANVNVSDLLERKGAKQGTDLVDYLVQYSYLDFINNGNKE